MLSSKEKSAAKQSSMSSNSCT